MLYPGAVWMGPSPNAGGAMGLVRLGVVHVMQGTLAGTDSWFMNPSAQVSAHFGIGKNGEVHQYVDTGIVAWAEAAYNGEAISIEHEGNSGDSLTPAQITADRALVRWLEQTAGIPLVMSTTNGWCGHGQLGVAGGNHPDCPGQPILDQWPTTVLNEPPVPPPKARQNMQTTDPQTNGVWCLRTDGSVWSYPTDGLTPPWLGGLNTSVGQGVNLANISGISAVDGPGNVGWGYAISVDNGLQGFAIYNFTRDGKFAKL